MNNNPFHQELHRAADIISGADVLVVAAGAGIGVDSGLPDFRGNDGFWRAYPALAASGIAFTEVASPRTFHLDPTLAWGFYGHRLNLYRQTVPHPGYELLREWMQSKPLQGWVFTSNVDGQFSKAGFASNSLHECHGSLHHLQCLEGCKSRIWAAADFTPDVDEATCRLRSEVPVCPVCGAVVRPNVLMFGDWAWLSHRTAEQQLRQSRWMESILGARIAVVEIGAGTAIPSVRRFCHELIQHYQAQLVRINPREFDVPLTQHVGIGMGSLQALQQMHVLM